MPLTIHHVLLIILCGISTFSFGQTDREKLDQLADSIWNITYSAPTLALELCEVLQKDARTIDYKEVLLLCLESKGEIFHVMANFDSSIFHYQQALDLSRELTDKDSEFRILGLMGYSMSINGNVVDGMDLLEQSLGVAVQLGDTSKMCEAHARLSSIHARMLNAERAMKESMRAVEYCRGANDYRSLAAIHSSMASVHLNLKNYDEAIQQNLAAIAINDSIGFARNSISTRANLANAYYEKGELEKAKSLNREVISRSDTVEAKLIGAAARINLALIYLDQDTLEPAEMLIAESLTISRKNNDLPYVVNGLVAYAQIALKRKAPAAAIDSLNACLEILKISADIKQEIEVLRYLSIAHAQIGSYRDAHDANIGRINLKDSLFHMQKSEEINRLQIQFNTEKKDQAIASLATQNELEQEKSNWLKMALAGLGLAALFVILAIIQKRRKDKTVLEGKLALERSERERLDEQLDFKNRELTEKALHLAQKNELLQNLKQELTELRTSDVGTDIQHLSNKIRFDQQIDSNWEQFTKAFTETKKGFFDKLRKKHPEVSKSEIRLSALLSMELSSKEVGAILNISDEGVRKARYRLRKKLELGKEDKLEQYLATF